MKATCYHYRDQNGNKVLGGSLGNTERTLDEAADQLTNELEIGVTPTGRITYMHNGKPVWVYFSVDPAETEKGQLVLREHKKVLRRLEEQRQAEQDALQEELDAAVGALGIRRAIEILKGGAS